MLRIEESSQALRAKAAEQQDVLELTRRYEVAFQALEDAEHKSAAAQLGAMVKGKGLKVDSIIEKWGGADGVVDRSEFHVQVRARFASDCF